MAPVRPPPTGPASTRGPPFGRGGNRGGNRGVGRGQPSPPRNRVVSEARGPAAIQPIGRGRGYPRGQANSRGGRGGSIGPVGGRGVGRGAASTPAVPEDRGAIIPPVGRGANGAAIVPAVPVNRSRTRSERRTITDTTAGAPVAPKAPLSLQV